MPLVTCGTKIFPEIFMIASDLVKKHWGQKVGDDDFYSKHSFVVIAGVAAYSSHKLKKEAFWDSSTDEQLEQFIPLTSSSAPDK